MSDQVFSKEDQILRMMKRVLTDIAKETHVPPGQEHILSKNTIMNIRDCLALITAREQELAQAAGRPMNMRPHFVDEPKKSVVVDFNTGKKGRKKPEEP